MKNLLITLSSLIFTFNVFALNGEDIFEEHSTAIIHLKVITREGKVFGGTGFFVKKSGLIFTNKHVIQPEDEETGYVYEVVAINGETLKNNGKNGYFNIQVPDVHDFADVALLRTEEKEIKDGDSILNISDSAPKIGEDVFLIGNPKSLKYSITSGILSYIGSFKVDKTDRDEGIRLQHTAPTLGGSSGSPILNKDGEVIGIHNSGLISTQGFNFGYHSLYLKELLVKFLNSNSITKKEPTEIIKPEFKKSMEPKNDLASLIRELKAYTPPEERKLGSL